MKLPLMNSYVTASISQNLHYLSMIFKFAISNYLFLFLTVTSFLRVSLFQCQSLHSCASLSIPVPVSPFLCQSLHSCASLSIPLPVSPFLCQSLHSSASLSIPLPVSSFLCQSLHSCASLFTPVPVSSLLCQSLHFILISVSLSSFVSPFQFYLYFSLLSLERGIIWRKFSQNIKSWQQNMKMLYENIMKLLFCNHMCVCVCVYIYINIYIFGWHLHN